MSKLKLTGVRNVPLLEKVDPDPNSEWLLALIISPNGKFIPSKQGEEEVEEVYHFKVVRPESLSRIGEKAVKIGRGYSKSQILRAVIFDYLKRAGKEETEENYEAIMDKITGKVEKWGLE